MSSDRTTKQDVDVTESDPLADVNTNIHQLTINNGWQKHRPPEYGAYRQQWGDVARGRLETDFAMNIDIQTTDVCNLKCPMCPHTVMWDQGSLDNRMMSREEYAHIIDQSAAAGAKAVKITYQNEPTAHKDIVWQVEYAKQKGILDVLINTNATLLRKERSTGLLKAGLDGLFVSFDAISPDLYAEQRVGTTIGKVIDNVYEFVQLRNKIRPGCQIRVAMVMYDDPKWRRQYEGLKIMWSHLVDSVGYSSFVDYDKGQDFPKMEGWACSQPFQRMVLKINGNVTVCCPDVHDEIVVGNWRREKLVDIWHGARAREVRRKHRENQYHQIEACRKCSYPVADK
jgi:radical SAM protein with 4Fe4S-binding SPASM domain